MYVCRTGVPTGVSGASLETDHRACAVRSEVSVPRCPVGLSGPQVFGGFFTSPRNSSLPTVYDVSLPG